MAEVNVQQKQLVVQQAVDFLHKSERIIEPCKQFPDGTRIAEDDRLEKGRALTKWGDSGWSQLVRIGKQQDGRFDDQLVVAACELIHERWKPSPALEWVAFVPSLHHPRLVSGFALRLAGILGIPHRDVVKKVRHTELQKMLQNSQQQYRNVHEAFKVEGGVPCGRVLLMDDMVDSRWTFTVVGVLLSQAGASSVTPFALADTAGRTTR